MTGDCHVRNCESAGVRFPRATRRISLADNIDLIVIYVEDFLVQKEYIVCLSVPSKALLLLM